VCLGHRHLVRAFEAGSPTQFLFTVPEILWEASLGIYLTVKGFKPSSPILNDNRQAGVRAGSRAPAVAAP
jgi:hypothetical protein